MTAGPDDVDGTGTEAEDVKKRIEDMPAESALGNRDPAGGGEGDPADYEGDKN